MPQMIQGAKGALVFLVQSDTDRISSDLFPQITVTLDAIQQISPTVASLEACQAAQQDALAWCDATTGARLRKDYPDTVVLVSATSGEYVDYLLDPTRNIADQIRAILLAERCRRRTINCHPHVEQRHSFDYTATGIVFNEEGTHVLLIPKPGDWWFPPGGHVENGEFPDRALIREIREETGYEVIFLRQDHPVGEVLGNAEVMPQPFWILKENMGSHYHYDFIYACQIVGPPQPGAEFERQGRWVAVWQMDDLHIPEDVTSAIRQLVPEGILVP